MNKREKREQVIMFLLTLGVMVVVLAILWGSTMYQERNLLKDELEVRDEMLKAKDEEMEELREELEKAEQDRAIYMDQIFNLNRELEKSQ